MTLPAFRHRVHTYTRRGVPPSSIRTRWRLGSNRRLVATIEWERLLPNDGPFAQTWQTLGIAGEYSRADGRSSGHADGRKPGPASGREQGLAQPVTSGLRFGNMGSHMRMARTADRSPLPLDVELPDRYEVRRRIANGGMASVWCARDRTLGRSVAIKLLSERYAHDPDGVLRFKREARTAARLSSHRHVVTIYDVGEASSPDGGRAFIVMEYLAGGTVADALRVGAINRREAVEWLRQAAAALDFAHSRGIVHRDIKPANFLLDTDRVLHVADFGIARIGTEDTITQSGEVLGTAAYLAPERALGREATEASDRYSLAVAAFELLTGERPFTAQHFAAQARQHLEAEPPAATELNPALPAAVDRVLARGLAKQPQERWPSAGAFAESIAAAMTGAGRRPRGANGTAPTRILTGRGAAPSRHVAVPPGRAGVPSGRGAVLSGRGAVPPGPGRGERRSTPSRVAAVLAALAVAAVAAVIALASGGSSPSPAKSAQSTHSTRASTPPKKPRAHPKAHRPAPATSTTASAPTTSTSPTTPTSGSPAGLQAQGHALMDAANYAAAIPILRQAVDSASPTSLTYAYALFDLGRSLRLSGDPQAAIPILYRRLQIPNQTDVVRQELQLALQAVGQKYRGSGGTAPRHPHGPKDGGAGQSFGGNSQGD